MKIRYLSDMHIDINSRHIEGSIFEYFLSKFSKQEADILVIAGDLAELKNAARIELFMDAATATHEYVLWVFGNHEYYTASIFPNGKALDDKIEMWEAYYNNLYILHNSYAIIKDITFYGCTLWSNVPDHRKFTALKYLNDFVYIKDLSIDAYNMLHREQANLLDTISADIVISHHAPHVNSVPPKYVGNDLNCCYYSNTLEKLSNPPKIWIHGHMHSSADYMIGNTRVLANPHGYGLENLDFDFNKIIEFST